MVIFALILAGLVLGVLSVALFSIWGLPIALLIVIGLAVALATAKKNDRSLGTIERTKRPEPTGRPRPASGSAETANHRQGQV
jgi:hypothetical protein